MYEQLGNLICRKAEIEDLTAMYTLIRPSITKEYDLRRLKKFIKYYINLKEACVITLDTEIVGFYAGKGTFIHYLISKGGPKAALLLLYVSLCGIHNRYLSSYFESFDSNIKIFEKLRTPDGKACILNKDTGRGEIPPRTKIYIEQLFRRFKNE